MTSQINYSSLLSENIYYWNLGGTWELFSYKGLELQGHLQVYVCETG